MTFENEVKGALAALSTHQALAVPAGVVLSGMEKLQKTPEDAAGILEIAEDEGELDEMFPGMENWREIKPGELAARVTLQFALSYLPAVLIFEYGVPRPAANAASDAVRTMLPKVILARRARLN